jgi:hypothetical protein
LQAFGTDGGKRVSLPPKLLGRWVAREDPLGGVVLAQLNGPADVESRDENLRLRWQVPISSTSVIDFAVDRQGQTLVLFPGNLTTARNTVEAMWIDRSGKASAVFRLAGPFPEDPSRITLTQRVGSGFFVLKGDTAIGPAEWVGQIESGSTAMMSPAPAWLQARPDTLLHVVHDGTGYAVSPLFSRSCSAPIEVIAPSGRSCGTATFTSSSASCGFNQIRVGYDGTLSMGFIEGPDRCSWEWWSGFFR